MTVAYDAAFLDLFGTDDGGGNSGISFRQVLNTADLIAATGNQCQVAFMWGLNNAVTSSAMSDAYIGQAATSGNAYDFTGNQVQLTFDGDTAVPGGTSAKVVGGISGTALTLSSVTSGTVQIGQWVSNNAEFFGIIESGSGDDWTLSIGGTLSAGSTIYCMAVTLSDVVTLGEDWDSTKNYVVSFDCASDETSADAIVATGYHSTLYYIAGSGLAGETAPSGDWTEQNTTAYLVAEILITQGASPGIPVWPFTM